MAPVDIGPLSEGHALVIPKYHGAKLHDIPDEHLGELLPVAKKIAIASGADQYNILQNNGRQAHQVVDHVHCKLHLNASTRTPHSDSHLFAVHVIPKPNAEQGLGIGWPTTSPAKEELAKIHEQIKGRLEKL